MITDYASLKTSIADWMNRSDLTDKLPQFIKFAEKKLNRDLNLHAWAQRATTDTVAGEAYIERPSGSGGIITIRLNTDPITSLDYGTNDYIDSINAGSTTGNPTLFSIQGNEIRLAPTPDRVYEVEISYFKEPTYLSDGNTTNWYIENQPDLLLAACMVEATKYTRDMNMYPVWKQDYEEMTRDLINEDNGKVYPQGETLQIKAM